MEFWVQLKWHLFERGRDCEREMKNRWISPPRPCTRTPIRPTGRTSTPWSRPSWCWCWGLASLYGSPVGQEGGKGGGCRACHKGGETFMRSIPHTCISNSLCSGSLCPMLNKPKKPYCANLRHLPAEEIFSGTLPKLLLLSSLLTTNLNN